MVDRSEAALREADAVDAARARGGPSSILDGVPVTVKVNVDTKGYPNSNGAPAYKRISHRATRRGRQSEKAGAIIIGITNTPEFSMRAVTEIRFMAAPKSMGFAITCGG